MRRKLVVVRWVSSAFAIGAVLFMASAARAPRVAHAAEALETEQKFLEAFNLEDQAAIRALVTDDFAVRNNADCVTPCEGLSELGVLLGIHLKVQVLSAQESGNTVTGRILATSNSFNLIVPGVTRIFADTQLVVRNGKVALLDLQLDLSDSQTAAVADQFRSARGPQAGPLGLQTQFVDALNRADLATIRSLITDDFVVTGNIGCSTPCQGDAFMQVFITIRLRISVLSTRVQDSTVVSRVSAESSRFDLIVPGVDRVLAQITATTRGGKVSSLNIQLDTSDSLSAALANDLRQTQVTAPAPSAPAAAAAAPAAARLPSTGDGGLLDQRSGHGLSFAALLATAIVMAAASSLTLARLALRRQRR